MVMLAALNRTQLIEQLTVDVVRSGQVARLWEDCLVSWGAGHGFSYLRETTPHHTTDGILIAFEFGVYAY